MSYPIKILHIREAGNLVLYSVHFNSFIMYTVKHVKNGHSEEDQNCFSRLITAECRGGGGDSAIRSTLIKLPFVIKIFVLSIFELAFYTGFTVICFL